MRSRAVTRANHQAGKTGSEGIADQLDSERWPNTTKKIIPFELSAGRGGIGEIYLIEITNVPSKKIEPRAQANPGKRAHRKAEKDKVRTTATHIVAWAGRTGILNFVAGIGERLVAQRERKPHRFP